MGGFLSCFPCFSKRQYRKGDMPRQSDENTALLLQTRAGIEHLRKHVVLKEKKYKLFGYFYLIWKNKKHITNKGAKLLESCFHEYYEYGRKHSLFTMFNEADNEKIACLCSNLFTSTHSVIQGDKMHYTDVKLFIQACRPVMKYIKGRINNKKITA